MGGEHRAGSRVSLCACCSGVAPTDLAVDDLDVIPAVAGQDDVELLLPAAAAAPAGGVVTGAGSAAPPPDEGPARLRVGRERVFARRVAVKALELAASAEEDRRTLAGLIGCAADPVTLTAEVMAAPRGGPPRRLLVGPRGAP